MIFHTILYIRTNFIVFLYILRISIFTCNLKGDVYAHWCAKTLWEALVSPCGSAGKFFRKNRVVLPHVF